VNLKLSDDIIFFFLVHYDTHHHFDHLQFDFRRASSGHQLEEQELLFIN
jgi:hypothetical protein